MPPSIHLFPLPLLLRSALIGCAALAGACATPAPLRGDFAEITPAEVARSPEAAASAQRVRWGGTILSLRNSPQESCFEILARPLSYSARPAAGDEEQGRFLACFAGFKDPKVFEPGRDVTVVGSVASLEPVKIDEFEYNYPKVAGSDIYLWRERDASQTVYVVDPFPFRYYGFGYYYYPTHYRAPPRSSATTAPDSSSVQRAMVIEKSDPAISLPSLGSSKGLLGR
jgi:outer membrane lipoprotein